MTIHRWLLTIFTLRLYLSLLSADQLQLVSTESNPDAFIQNGVNVINGDYYESATDLVITGPDALVLQRFFNIRNVITGVQARRWSIFSQRFLIIGKDPSGKSCDVGKDRFEWIFAFTGERSGGILPYSGWKNTNGSTKKPFKIDVLNSAIGLVNTYAQEINGQTNHQNNLLHCKGDTCELSLSDETKRIYQRINDLPSQLLGEELIPSMADQVIDPSYFLLIKEILTIWSEFLPLEASKISTTDNFFHIGGNSLLPFQALNQINHSTPLKISVLDIYQHLTINKLAIFMMNQVMSNKNYSLLPIRTGGTRNLFLIHAGATTVLPCLHFTNLEGWSVYGISNPYFGQETGFKSITEMTTCYLDQIKEMQIEGPYYVGGWSLGGTVALEMAHLLESRGEAVAFALLFDTVNWQGIPDVKRNYYEFAKKVRDGIDLDLNTPQMIAIELEKSEPLLKQHIPNPFGGGRFC